MLLWIAMVSPAQVEAMEKRIHCAVLSLPAISPADRRMAVSTGTGKRRIRDLRERKLYP